MKILFALLAALVVLGLFIVIMIKTKKARVKVDVYTCPECEEKDCTCYKK